MRNKILAIMMCKVFGHIYPLKKLPNSDYFKMLNLQDFKDPRVGAFVADTSKPCHRCGAIK